MSLPSIVSYGAAAKTSSLVWDGDLVIPDGYSIESASGEVAISGDVSVSGSVSADTEVNTQLLTASNITLAEHPLTLITHTVASKSIVVGDNTFAVVSAGGAKITGSITCKSSYNNEQSVSLIFTATDALGVSKEIKRYIVRINDGKSKTQNVDVDVPAGTVKVGVQAIPSTSYITVTSVSMTMSKYTSAFVC